MEISIAIITICCALLSIIMIALAPLFSFIHIIPEYQKAVTKRRKKLENTTAQVHDSGFLFINPFTTRLYKVDMRDQEKHTEVPAISKSDNTKIKIQTQWSFRIIDPVKSIEVVSIDVALEGLGIAILREIAESDSIESMQKNQLEIEKKWVERMNDKVGNRWGVKVLQFEMQKIIRDTVDVV